MTNVSLFSGPILNSLVHPDGGSLERAEGGFHDTRTGEVYPDERGVPSLFVPSEGEGSDMTTRVRSFYEENPFPNYDGARDFKTASPPSFWTRSATTS